MSLHTIVFRRLECADTSGFFAKPFAPKCRIVKIGFAQSENGGTASGATLKLYRSPDINPTILGSSNVPNEAPEGEQIDPRLYEVTEPGSPITVTAGGATLRNYGTVGGHLPYVAIMNKLDAKEKFIYLVIQPDQPNTFWDVVLDIEKE